MVGTRIFVLVSEIRTSSSQCVFKDVKKRCVCVWLSRKSQRKKERGRDKESLRARVLYCQCVCALFCMCVFALMTTELQVRAGWVGDVVC